MKILVIVVTHNCAEIIPFFLRYYSNIADEIWSFDDASTDGTRELLAQCPKVKLENWPHPGSGIDDDLFLNFAYDTYPKAAGWFDWVIFVDPDEIVYHPNMSGVLEEIIGRGDVIRTCGFNMISESFPKDDGRQIWEILPFGVRAPVYSKPVVFNPKIMVRWDRGKHHLERCSPFMSSERSIKLLHYRYLGVEYTRKRNAENYARCGLDRNDKGAAWSCSTTWKGEGSPEWVALALKETFNVLEAPFYD